MSILDRITVLIVTVVFVVAFNTLRNEVSDLREINKQLTISDSLLTVGLRQSAENDNLLLALVKSKQFNNLTQR